MKTVVDANGIELHVGDRVIVVEPGLDFNRSTIGKEATVRVIGAGGYEIGLCFDEAIAGGHSLGGRLDVPTGFFGFGAQVVLTNDVPANITVSFEDLFGDISKL